MRSVTLTVNEDEKIASYNFFRKMKGILQAWKQYNLPAGTTQRYVYQPSNR